jgi:hypothetical protein
MMGTPGSREGEGDGDGEGEGETDGGADLPQAARTSGSKSKTAASFFKQITFFRDGDITTPALYHTLRRKASAALRAGMAVNS